jgi:hypothetical protein
MAQRQRFSTRDEVYLDSPGFEPYMASGLVFALVLGAIFIVSIKLSFAWLIWPGMFVAVLSGYIVLNLFQRREYARKLAEVKADPAPPEVTTQ